MKTNHAKVGGSLCGLVDAPMRRSQLDQILRRLPAAVRALLRTAAHSHRMLGFSNEPEIVVGYDSMTFQPGAGRRFFFTSLGPAVRKSASICAFVLRCIHLGGRKSFTAAIERSGEAVCR